MPKSNKLFRRLYYTVSLLIFILKGVSNKSVIFISLLKLLEGNASVVLRLKNGTFFHIRDMYDILAVKEVFYDQIYKFIFSDNPNKTIFIDIGCYIGDCVIYANQFSTIEQIVAFEPYSQNYNIAKKNITQNKINKCHLYQKAVSIKKGNLDFYIYPNKGQSGLTKNGDKLQDKTRVPVVSFSDIMKGIDSDSIILKSDCEGEEYNIFMNTPKSVLRRLKKITFEYHDEFQFSKIKKRLDDIGFHVNYINHPIENNIGTAYAILKK